MTYFLIYAAICAPISVWLMARSDEEATLTTVIIYAILGWVSVPIYTLIAADKIVLWRKKDDRPRED